MRARATQAAAGRLAAQQRAQPAASESSTVRNARALLQVLRRLLLQSRLRPRARADDVLLQDLCSSTNTSRRFQSKGGVSAKRRVAGRKDDIARANREAARRSRRSYREVWRLLRCPAEVPFNAPQTFTVGEGFQPSRDEVTTPRHKNATWHASASLGIGLHRRADTLAAAASLCSLREAQQSAANGVACGL